MRREGFSVWEILLGEQRPNQTSRRQSQKTGRDVLIFFRRRDDIALQQLIGEGGQVARTV